MALRVRACVSSNFQIYKCRYCGEVPPLKRLAAGSSVTGSIVFAVQKLADAYRLARMLEYRKYTIKIKTKKRNNSPVIDR